MRDRNVEQATRQQKTKDISELKPGSSTEDARQVGGKDDFGASVHDRAERDYASRNTRMSDPGTAQPHSGEGGGARESGAGGTRSGAGSSSGGDVDPDIIGFGADGAISASGDIERRYGPDDSDGSSDVFASGGHAERKNQTEAGTIGGSKRIDGSTIQEPDAQTLEGGADDATNPDLREDDSFKGEISSSEGSGRDQAGL